MKEYRELHNDELNDVVGGSACATGNHIKEGTLTSRKSTPDPNPWQDWMGSYYGVVPQ
jgi:hypothetical protein